MPGIFLAAGSMTGGGIDGSEGSIDIATVGGFPNDNSASDTRLLQVILAVTALSGGVSPTVAVVTSRYEVDNCGNPTGVATAIDSPAALSAVGTQTRAIGPNQAQAAKLAKAAKIAVTVTGGPTTLAWTLFATMTD